MKSHISSDGHRRRRNLASARWLGLFVTSSKPRVHLGKVGSGQHTELSLRNEPSLPRLTPKGPTSGARRLLWNRPVGPESKEAAILRRLMQETIGNELRARYEPPLELPRDLLTRVKEIEE